MNELATPPTQLEVAQLLTAATRPDHSLTPAGAMVLRRLAFDRDRVTAERDKLREAIRAAGFAVMETSGAWSIHDVSEKAKQLEADDLKRVN